MMRSELMVVSILALAWAASAEAAGRSGADLCMNAGFRMGTLSFDMCVARVEGDDPLSGLDQAVDDERVPVAGTKAVAPREDALSGLEPERLKPPVAPVKPMVREGEFPTVMGASFPGGGLPGGEPPPPNNIPNSPPPSAPPPPANGGFGTPTAPTPPTAPQINTFTVTVPMWSWGQ